MWLMCKGGRPQFKSAPPQLRNIADNQIDSRNSATIRSLLPILFLSGTFSSAQDGFKNQPKIFLELPVSLEIKNLPLRDSYTRFLPPIFFSWTLTGFYGQKYAENCGLEVADIRKNCDCGIAELRLRSNISLKSCGIAIAEVFPSSCGIAIADSKKMLRVPTSAHV